MKENKYLEFKLQITNTFLKTVSAFANYGTGIIKFGVNDSGINIGIENPESVCLDIENKINDNIHPRPNFSLKVNYNTKVVTLCVEEGIDKPYLYKGKAYKRNDTSTIEVERNELNRLTLIGTCKSYDQITSLMQNLTFNSLENQIKTKLDVQTINKDILKVLNLYSDLDGYNRAAELLADVNNFPGVDIARFGNDIDEITDRKQIVRTSIINQYIESIEMFEKYYTYEKIEGAERKKRELIPEKAFREAIANAIIHRAWDVNGNIHVSMFKDRIEISSPGGLPFGVSETSYRNDYVSVLRNPIIANVFFRLNYIEMFGTGIKRIQNSYRDYQFKPEFIISDEAIVVILPTSSKISNLTLDENHVFKVFSKGIMLSSSDVVNKTEFSRDKCIRLLNSLVEKRILIKTGNGKGTKYSIE